MCSYSSYAVCLTEFRSKFGYYSLMYKYELYFVSQRVSIIIIKLLLGPLQHAHTAGLH